MSTMTLFLLGVYGLNSKEVNSTLVYFLYTHKTSSSQVLCSLAMFWFRLMKCIQTSYEKGAHLFQLWLVGVLGFLEAMCLYVSRMRKSWALKIEGWLSDVVCCDEVFGHSWLGWDITWVVHISWLLSPFLTRFCHHVNGHGHRCSNVRVFSVFLVTTLRPCLGM